MKIILVISLIFSFIFASENRIVVGSYHKQSNVLNAKNALDYMIKSNQNLHFILLKNGVETKYKKIGKYYILSIEPFKNKSKLFKIYNKIKDLYPDAYTLEITTTKKISTSTTDVLDNPFLKNQEPTEDDFTIAEEKNLKIDLDENTFIEKEKENVISKKIKKLVKDLNKEENETILKEEPHIDKIAVVKKKEDVKQIEKENKVVEKNHNSIIEYTYYIVFIIILLIALIGFYLYKKTNKDEQEVTLARETQEIKDIQIDDKVEENYLDISNKKPQNIQEEFEENYDEIDISDSYESQIDLSNISEDKSTKK